MADSVTVSVYMPKDLHTWLEAQAKLQDRSRNWLIVKAVQEARRAANAA